MRNVILQSNTPLIIALDCTGSMTHADAPDGRTRLRYAIDRIEELLKQLPQQMLITLVAFGSTVRVLGERNVSPMQARAQLMLGTAGAETNDVQTLTGLLLEWALSTLQGQKRAQLLIVTDGQPEDTQRFEAYGHWNALNEHRLAITVLQLGELTRDGFSAIARFEQHTVAPLADTECMVAKAASEPPDGSDPARANTLPPSVAPPSAPPPDHEEAPKKRGKR